MNSKVAQVVQSPITEAYSWLDETEPGQGVVQQELLDVSQAVPGYPPATALTEHLAGTLTDPALSRYTDQRGTLGLREAFARDVGSAYQTAIDPTWVAITAGCNQAFCLTITALAEPGDEVILVLPYYFNHDMWLKMQSLVPVYLKTDEAQMPSPEAVRKAITAKTRAVVLISPNNPTGCVYPPELLGKIHAACSESGVPLVLDETYRDFRATSEPPHDLFSKQSAAPESFVHLYSFSKVFSVTGYRVGALVASPRLIEEIEKVMDCMAICPPAPGQAAVQFALEQLGEWRESKRHLMLKRVETFTASLADSMAGTEAPYQLVSAGAYFAYLAHPFEGQSSRTVARHLVKTEQLLSLAGGMFGPHQETYLRLAFANLETERIPELTDRLRRSLERPPGS